MRAGSIISFLLSLLLCLVALFVGPAESGPCNGLPFSSDACSGTGYLSPAYGTTLFSSDSVNTKTTLSISISSCPQNAVQRSIFIYSWNSGVTTSFNELISDRNSRPPTISTDLNMGTDNAYIEWTVYRDCWTPKHKKSTINDVANNVLYNEDFSYTLPAPGVSKDPGFSSVTDCYVRDQGTHDFLCSRALTFCRRQSDATLSSPQTNAVFQQSPITFTWSDITPTLSLCLTATTSFVYEFKIWTNQSFLATPVYSTTVLVSQGATFTLPAGTLGAGSYWWSVRSNRTVAQAKLANGASSSTITQYAALRQFRYCGANIAPEQPVLTSPSNNQVMESAVITGSGPSATISVTLSWTIGDFGVTCLTSTPGFIISYSSSSSFSTSVTARLDATTTTVTRDFPVGTWYWNITAVNGGLSTVSAQGLFVVCPLFPPTAFTISTPANNANNLDYTSIFFNWTTSTPQNTCVPNNSITYTMKSGPTATNMVTNSTGPATNVTFSPFNKGTWYWAVTATDLKGQSTTTPVATFVTVNSVCADTGPIAGGIVPPIYTYQSNAINVKIGWTAADLGISCTTPVVPGYSLVIKNPSDAVFLSQNYTITNYTATVAPSTVGVYTWIVTVTNAKGATAAYAQGNFTICNITELSSFATNFSPATGFLDASQSLTTLSWQFTGSQTNCLGEMVSYRATIMGASSSNTQIFSDRLTTSMDISNLVDGTWTWSLENDVSAIPIPGLPTKKYTGSFSICSPDDPKIPALTSPGRFLQVTGTSANLTWYDPHNAQDSCTHFYTLGQLAEQYTYKVFMSRTPAFTSIPVFTSTAVLRNGATNFTYSPTNLAPGSQFWKVQVVKEVLISSVVKVTKTQNTLSSVFTICISTPPAVPTLVFPANATVFDRCNITAIFSWNPIIPSDFGVDCTNRPVKGIRLYVGEDPDNLSDMYELLSFQSNSDPISVVNAAKFHPNKWYFWQVEAYNTLFNTSSEIFTFKTPNTALTACSGHGQCNVGGTCACSAGFTGATCASAIPTDPPGETEQNNTQSPVGGIVGGIIAALLIILFLAGAAFFVIRRRAKKLLERPVRPPPDFPPLAFTVPPGYPPLATEKIVPWYSFEQLLVVYGFALPFAILDNTQATEIDDVIKSLVFIIESHGQGANFVKALITKDLKEKKESNNLTSATLFRDNSHASKAFKNYAKIVGLPYLFYIFGDAVYEICGSQDREESKKSDTIKRGSMKKGEMELQQIVVRRSSSGQSPLFDMGSFEVDPNKMSEDDDVLSNAIYLQLKCQKLLVKVFRSPAIFPQAFVDIFVHLMNEVQGSLSREDGFNAIAAFVFLRLVNPSILFPHQYGLIEAPPNNEGLTRQLILITKVLQNLANGVHFGNKEQHMSPMNDFIDSNKEPLRRFLDDIISKEPEPPKTKSKTAAFNGVDAVTPKRSIGDDNFFEPLDVPRSAVETSLSVMYNQYCRTKDKSLESLAKYRSSDDVKVITNKTNAIMDALGEPIARNTGTMGTMGRKE